MTTVYISSTYQDLVECRELTAKTLRQMNKVVVSMENYTASDMRPLDQCLADVNKCDLYIGIFAWRYGFVPPNDNPDKKSITELEYLKALELRKPCLIFLAAENAPWPVNQIDRKPEEGEGGHKIASLRERLQLMHLCKFFQGSGDLA